MGTPANTRLWRVDPPRTSVRLSPSGDHGSCLGRRRGRCLDPSGTARRFESQRGGVPAAGQRGRGSPGAVQPTSSTDVARRSVRTVSRIGCGGAVRRPERQLADHGVVLGVGPQQALGPHRVVLEPHLDPGGGLVLTVDASSPRSRTSTAGVTCLARSSSQPAEERERRRPRWPRSRPRVARARARRTGRRARRAWSRPHARTRRGSRRGPGRARPSYDETHAARPSHRPSRRPPSHARPRAPRRRVEQGCGDDGEVRRRGRRRPRRDLHRRGARLDPQPEDGPPRHPARTSAEVRREEMDRAARHPRRAAGLARLRRLRLARGRPAAAAARGLLRARSRSRRRPPRWCA